MRIWSIMVAIGIAGAMPAALADEALGDYDFARQTIPVYKNVKGSPSDTLLTKIDVRNLQRDKVYMKKWDPKSHMMLVDFGEGDVGWVAKRLFIPPITVCHVHTQSASAQGLAANDRTAGSRGLGEMLCPGQ